MKKFALIGLLALPLAAYPQQKASAWCSFSLSHSCSVSFSHGCGGFNFSVNPSYPPSCPSFGGGYDQACYGGMNYDSAYAAAPAAAPAVESAPARALPTQYQPAYNAASGYLPVGYYYPSVGYSYYPYAGYGYGQAPAYWYGR